MISDFLWTNATSDALLFTLGVVAVIAATIGYFPVLSSLPIFASYVVIARIVWFVLLAAICFLIGFRVADNRAELKALASVVEIKDGVIGAQKLDIFIAKSMAESADEERTAALARATDAEKRIDDYAEKLKARPNAACLLTPDDFADRVRNDGKRK